MENYNNIINFDLLSVYDEEIKKYIDKKSVPDGTVYRYVGTVNTYAELPTEAEIGNVYNVVELSGMNFAWTGETWDELGSIIDTSNFVVATGGPDHGNPTARISRGSTIGGMRSSTVSVTTDNISLKSFYEASVTEGDTNAEYDTTLIVADKVTINGNEVLTTANAVGKKGSGTSSEIFNDYNNNTASGTRSHAEGYKTTASNTNAHAEGESTTASGSDSHAEGYNTKAEASTSHAEGYSTTALGSKTHAEGSGTKAIKSTSHAEGENTITNGNDSHAEGYGTITGPVPDGTTRPSVSSNSAQGTFAHAEGNATWALGNSSHAEGMGTTAEKKGTHAEGYKTTASGIYAHSEGQETTASMDGAHAEGYRTKATGAFSHAEGDGATASARGAHAEGESHASGVDSHAEGSANYAYAAGSHAEGQYTKAHANNSHSEGEDTEVFGGAAHVEGTNTITERYAGHAEGSGSHAQGPAAHAEGGHWKWYISNNVPDKPETDAWQSAANPNGKYIAEMAGSGTVAVGASSHSEGVSTQAGSTYKSIAAHAEGAYTRALNTAAHSEGRANIVSIGSLTMFSKNSGELRYDTVNGEVNGEIKYRKVEIGDTVILRYTTAATESASSSIRSYDEKIVSVTHLEVDSLLDDIQFEETSNYTVGTTFDVSLVLSFTESTGVASHAEGVGTHAYGEGSHSEGLRTTADWAYAHIEGESSKIAPAINKGGTKNQYQDDAETKWKDSRRTFSLSGGDSTHVEGKDNLALGIYAHAEGHANLARGPVSHAEGDSNYVYGTYAHAEGYSNEIGNNGFAAHVEGEGNKTNVRNQTVVGKYNKENADALFIVGNGSGKADNKRSNAFEVISTAEGASIKVGETILTEELIKTLTSPEGLSALIERVADLEAKLAYKQL